jgi:hypothetical protein
MRRLLARLLVALVLAGGLVPLTAGASWACSCHPTTTTEDEQWRAIAAEAPFVYVAEVVEERQVQTPEGYAEREYVLRATNSLKGGVMGTRTVRTAQHGALCGVTLDQTRRVLVHAGQMDICNGGGTQARVPERAAIVEWALHREPTSYVAGSGQTVRGIAAEELQQQLGTAPSREHLRFAERLLHQTNRKVLGPRPRGGPARDAAARTAADLTGPQPAKGSAAASRPASRSCSASKTPGAAASTSAPLGGAPRRPPTRAPASVAMSSPALMSQGESPCS